MVKVTIFAAGNISIARGLPYTVEFSEKHPQDVAIAQVKAALAQKFPQFYPSRQKLTRKDDKKTLTDELNLIEAGVSDGEELIVKDLGPQISWKTVFLVEYAGPLLSHPLMYHFPGFVYGGPVQHSLLQKYIYTFVIIHFVKRELETLFVHRFSHDTMPFINIFKNSAHYHLLAGLALAYPLYSPTYSATSPYIVGTIRDSPSALMLGAAVWTYAEISNFITHMIVRNLRPAGTRNRAIPYGYGFSSVSFPNYFFEILAWSAIAVMTGSYMAYVFLAVSSYTMGRWALKKHKSYRKEFGNDYPRNRKAIIPFLL